MSDTLTQLPLVTPTKVGYSAGIALGRGLTRSLRRFVTMKKPLLTALLVIFVALSFAEKTAPTGKKDCLPCTPYCKKHPNAPQCN